MDCYGNYNKHSDCPACQYAGYCKESTEVNHDAFSDHAVYVEQAETKKQYVDDTRYSSTQVVQLVRFVLNISNNEEIRHFLVQKLETPDITLSNFARARGVSKQAIHKAFKRVTSQYPELAEILHNKPSYNKWRQAI